MSLYLLLASTANARHKPIWFTLPNPSAPDLLEPGEHQFIWTFYRDFGDSPVVRNDTVKISLTIAVLLFIFFYILSYTIFPL